MFAVYRYQPGTTAANLTADVVKILTGETNKTNLSSDCVQADTSISAAYAVAGWSVHDASAYTDGQMLKALDAAGSMYKYYALKGTSTTALDFYVAETWNATNHTGTNVRGPYTTTWSSANGGYLYIYASQQLILIRSYCSATWQALYGGFCVEMPRIGAKGTIPATYPVHACSTNNFSITGGYAAAPRFKNGSTSGDTTSPSITFVGAPTTGSGVYRDASETEYVTIFKSGLIAYLSTYPGYTAAGYVLGDYFVTAPAFGNLLDEITYDSKTYINYVSDSSTARIWLPKG